MLYMLYEKKAVLNHISVIFEKTCTRMCIVVCGFKQVAAHQNQIPFFNGLFETLPK